MSSTKKINPEFKDEATPNVKWNKNCVCQVIDVSNIESVNIWHKNLNTKILLVARIYCVKHNNVM